MGLVLSEESVFWQLFEYSEEKFSFRGVEGQMISSHSSGDLFQCVVLESYA